MSKKIPFVNIGQQWKMEKRLLLPIIKKILSSGKYVGGEEIEKFEKRIAKICGVKYAVALNSGTDSLTMALALSGVRRGDEVITTPNSFIATTAAIVHLGAKPVFVDVLPNLNMDPSKIIEKITTRTKAILPTHLAGRVCDMETICKIANKHNLAIIEDAAQSIGSKFNSRPSGSFGKVGCFSAHPLKNLNACGDGGYLTTDDKKIFEGAISLRNHGLSDRNTVEKFGFVSRLDNLQAGILNFRLKNLNKIIKKRRENASIYLKNISWERIFFPRETKKEFNTYHLFVIQTTLRDRLLKFLKKNNVITGIHYPVPIHLQPAAKFLNYKKGDFPVAEKQAKEILSLPINQSLSKKNIEKIANLINHFQKNI